MNWHEEIERYVGDYFNAKLGYDATISKLQDNYLVSTEKGAGRDEILIHPDVLVTKKNVIQAVIEIVGTSPGRKVEYIGVLMATDISLESPLHKEYSPDVKWIGIVPNKEKQDVAEGVIDKTKTRLKYISPNNLHIIIAESREDVEKNLNSIFKNDQMHSMTIKH